MESSENIIPLRIPHDLAHPASKNYPVSDDPLADLLFEFEEEPAEEVEEDTDYMYVPHATEDLKISMQDSIITMSEKILKQLHRIKEDSKRLKYYMDEVEDYLID